MRRTAKLLREEKKITKNKRSEKKRYKEKLSR